MSNPGENPIQIAEFSSRTPFATDSWLHRYAGAENSKIRTWSREVWDIDGWLVATDGWLIVAIRGTVPISQVSMIDDMSLRKQALASLTPFMGREPGCGEPLHQRLSCHDRWKVGYSNAKTKTSGLSYYRPFTGLPA